MIHVAIRIIYASISGFFFEGLIKQTCYARDNKHLLLEYALTSRSFLEERQSIGTILGRHGDVLSIAKNATHILAGKNNAVRCIATLAEYFGCAYKL